MPVEIAEVSEQFERHLQELVDAVDFFDRVLASSWAEKNAVGNDHHHRLELAARNVAAFAQKSGAPVGRRALADIRAKVDSRFKRW
jgi:hypothetical protein